ncbi:MAG: sulfur carrier protein ThiS [Aureliella sp.]
MSENSISIQFNGQSLDLPADATVRQLLEHVKMRSQLVAVEINMEIIPKDNHASHRLQSGDVVEVVTLVGGG